MEEHEFALSDVHLEHTQSSRIKTGSTRIRDYEGKHCIKMTKFYKLNLLHINEKMYKNGSTEISHMLSFFHIKLNQ